MIKNNLTKGLCAALLLASPMVGADPRYPAADFQPVIISQDAELIAKHSQAAKAVQGESSKLSPAATSAVASQQNNAESKPEQPLSKKEEASMENYPIALVILALAGFIFWSTKRPGAKSQIIEQVAPRLFEGTAGGETGVAKYLKSISESAVTVTGVAKYLINMEAEAKAKAAEAKKASKTGVEKYLDGLGH